MEIEIGDLGPANHRLQVGETTRQLLAYEDISWLPVTLALLRPSLNALPSTLALLDHR
jgi:hypothetical protein